MPKVKTKRAPLVTVRDMSRYEEEVDQLLSEIEQLEWNTDEWDTVERAKDAVESLFNELRSRADRIHWEYQMMQVERKECVRPTTLV